MTRTPTATVIVATRDRPTALAACLAALATQSIADELEVVVVDDGSADAAAVAAVVAGAPPAALVRLDGGGPAAARNAGARAATAPLVIFIDDDCTPTPPWAAALVAALGAADAAVGATRPGPAARSTSIAWHTIVDHLVDESLDPAGGGVGFGPSCNLACRAAVARAFSFDERYPLAAGEDRDWCARLTAAGLTLVSAPDAVVHHHQDLDVRGFWRQQLRYGRGAQRFHRNRAPRRPRPAFYVRLLRRGLRAGPATLALVALAQVATAVGFALESRRRDDRSPDG